MEELKCVLRASTPGSGGSHGGPIVYRLISLESVKKNAFYSQLLHSQYESIIGKCTDDYKMFFYLKSYSTYYFQKVIKIILNDHLKNTITKN